MRIIDLKLKKFRNYNDLNLNFNSGLNIFIGDNAQGKTSILEAIYMLAITKSHLTNNDIEVIKHNELSSLIKGQVEIGGYKKNLSIKINNSSKVISINNSKVSKIREYISKLNIILFSPLDLELIKGSPINRRKFLNVEIGQLDNNYLDILSKYNRIIKTRNEYLRKNELSTINQDYLMVINEKYVDYAILIYKYRIEFINFINNYLADIYQDITGFKGLFLKYQPNVKINIENFQEIEIRKQMLDKIHQNQKKEILIGTSIYGPHRDDFSFLLNEQDLSLYGSQGQQRSAIISLKLSEIDIFKDKIHEYPIVLLDDIFSELDKKTRNRLLKKLRSEIQVLITTNDLSNISKKILNESTIKVIKNGRLEEKVYGKRTL